MQKTKFSVRDMATVGVLAALVFVTTYFLKIGPIATPAGPTMIKVGNVVCILGALLFGGVRGGLAAGIGSMIYDLTDPAFVSSAPFTFVFFFLMAFICGVISHAHGRDGKDAKWNAVGAVAGAASYLVLHLGKTLITLMLSGSGLAAALTASGVKFITSGVNAVIAVVVSLLLAPVFRKALVGAHIIES